LTKGALDLHTYRSHLGAYDKAGKNHPKINNFRSTSRLVLKPIDNVEMDADDIL
jgi:hypothetical protein